MYSSVVQGLLWWSWSEGLALLFKLLGKFARLALVIHYSFLYIFKRFSIFINPFSKSIRISA